MTEAPTCVSCKKPWRYHLGAEGLCRRILALETELTLLRWAVGEREPKPGTTTNRIVMPATKRTKKAKPRNG
jgi:hypothetical protein